MKVIIAGAGIGGLLLAVALLKQGFKVQVFERDLTAIRGEGKYRGPIQVRRLGKPSSTFLGEGQQVVVNIVVYNIMMTLGDTLRDVAASLRHA